MIRKQLLRKWESKWIRKLVVSATAAATSLRPVLVATDVRPKRTTVVRSATMRDMLKFDAGNVVAREKSKSSSPRFATNNWKSLPQKVTASGHG